MAGIISPGRFRLATKAIPIAPLEGHEVRFPKVELVADPYLQDKATLTQGRWAAATEPATPLEPGEWLVLPSRTEVTLSEPAALRLGWAVGETRTIIESQTLTLVGTYVADDPNDRYWDHSPAAAAPRVIDDPDLGITVVAAGYVGPDLGVMSTYTPQLSLWYPVEASSLTAGQLDEVISQLRGFTANRQDVGVPATFSTELIPVLETLRRDLGATVSLIAFLAAGPLAVLVMLLVAAVRMLQIGRAHV